MSSDSPKKTHMAELERLQEAGIEVLRRQRPKDPPLMFFLNPIREWNW